MSTRSTLRRIFPLVLALALTALLSACSSSATGTTSAQTPTTTETATGGDGTPTSGSTPDSSATPTPTPVTSCAQVSGFSSAGSVSTGSAFSEVGFPANTVGFVKQLSETNSYQFKILSACTKGQSTGYIHTYFKSGLPSTGFAQSSTYPYKGNASAACGDPYCWYKDGSHPSWEARRYISLENVTSVGSVVTYDLRLSIAPLTHMATIQGTYTYDLDQPTSDDVQWDQVTSTTRHMDPTNGATLVNMGSVSFKSVTVAQLKGLSYSTTPIDGSDATNKLANGDVFAVHTGSGHYVKVQVVSTGPAPSHTLSITYVLYDMSFYARPARAANRMPGAGASPAGDRPMGMSIAYGLYFATQAGAPATRAGVPPSAHRQSEWHLGRETTAHERRASHAPATPGS